MLEALPLDCERDLEAQIEIASGAGRWATRRCAGCSTRSSTASPSRLYGHLVEAEKDGELRDGVDIELAAHQLLVLIDGLSAERCSPRRVSPDRQREMLDELLRGLRGCVLNRLA